MENQSKTSSKKLTLKELRNNLPIEVKGKKDQSFTFLEWGFEEEKKIAEAKKNFENIGKFISQVLFLMLKTLNGDEFQKRDSKEKILAINQMSLSNVLYMYIYLRYDQLGEEIALNFECPSCGSMIENFVASLGDVDVDCKVGEYEEIINYKLRKPINLEKGDMLIDNLNIGLVKWDTMERSDQAISSNAGELKQHMLNSGIYGSEGHKDYLSNDEVLKKVKKIDIENINKLISIHNAGPTIQAEVRCSKCGKKHFHAIEWSYDYFFGAGSLPQL